jgi:hypothetical protein
MKRLIFFLLFLLPYLAYSQKKIRTSDLVGSWKYQSIVNTDNVVVSSSGIMIYKSNKEFKLTGSVSSKILGFTLGFEEKGTYKLVDNIIIYKVDSFNFPKYPSFEKYYIKYLTGLLSDTKIEAFDDDNLFVTDHGNKFIYEKIKKQ